MMMYRKHILFATAMLFWAAVAKGQSKLNASGKIDVTLLGSDRQFAISNGYLGKISDAQDIKKGTVLRKTFSGNVLCTVGSDTMLCDSMVYNTKEETLSAYQVRYVSSYLPTIVSNYMSFSEEKESINFAQSVRFMSDRSVKHFDEMTLKIIDHRTMITTIK